MSASLFWVAFGLIAYHHVAYPIIIRLCLARGSFPRRKPDATVGHFGDLPSVTVIVPAHNEAAVIGAKIRNLVALDYPADLLTCIIALDGCTDSTCALAEAALKKGRPGLFTLIDYQPNIGKVAVLNDQIAQAESDIVALTDTSALVNADALLRAAQHFRDPTVGVVTGTYSVAGSGGHGETSYWRYQSDVRAGESALAGPIGAHGAFYLFRRSAWTPLPADTINDDFVLPMTIVLHGFRAVLDPAITATELEQTKSRQEFRRRIRIGAGNLQQVVRLAPLSDPRRGWISFAFISGKGLRGILPFLLILLVLTSLWQALEGSRVFGFLFALEMLAIGCTLWGRTFPSVHRNRLISTLIYVLEGYIAMTIGALMVLLRQEGKVWRLSKTFDPNRPA